MAHRHWRTYFTSTQYETFDDTINSKTNSEMKNNKSAFTRGFEGKWIFTSLLTRLLNSAKNKGWSVSLSSAYTTKHVLAKRYQSEVCQPIMVVSYTLRLPYLYFQCSFSFIWLFIIFFTHQKIFNSFSSLAQTHSMSTVSKNRTPTPWNKTMSLVQNGVSCHNISRNVAWPDVIWLFCQEWKKNGYWRDISNSHAAIISFQLLFGEEYKLDENKNLKKSKKKKFEF